MPDAVALTNHNRQMNCLSYRVRCELQEMGGMVGPLAIELWRQTYMPMLRELFQRTGSIRNCGTLPHGRSLLAQHRAGRLTIPLRYRAEVDAMGGLGPTDLEDEWTTIFLPALREFYQNHGHLEVPPDTPIIGNLVQSLG